jgi:hypothetical protein
MIDDPVKISARTELAAIEGTDMLGVYRPGTPNVDYKISTANALAGMVQPVNDPVTLDGVDSTTTAVLIYGINVIQTSTTSDFCTRLPLTPKKGKSVVIVNNSGFIARVYPSVTGGSINGIVDGFVDIPADKKSYTFFCWENPLPGSWSIQSPLSTKVVIAEMSVTHTNGVADVRCGTGVVQTSSIGAGLDGSFNITLTPASNFWRSENVPAVASRMNVYTNIVADDLVSDIDPDSIFAFRTSAYKSASNGVTSGQRETAKFGKTGPQDVGDPVPAISGIVNGGTLNSPPLVGDAGTFWQTVFANDTLNNQIGTGGQYSRYYYIFGFLVPANAISKTYRFQFVLEYN